MSHDELQNPNGHEQLVRDKKAGSLAVLPTSTVEGVQVNQYVQGFWQKFKLNYLKYPCVFNIREGGVTFGDGGKLWLEVFSVVGAGATGGGVEAWAADEGMRPM